MKLKTLPLINSSDPNLLKFVKSYKAWEPPVILEEFLLLFFFLCHSTGGLFGVRYHLCVYIYICG